MNQKQSDIQKIWHGLKDLIFSIAFIIAAIALLLFIYNALDLKGLKPEAVMSEHQNVVIFVGIIFGTVFVLLLTSIYRIAKSLKKNAAAWLFACIAFPILLYFAIPYFFIAGVYTIIKLKFTKNVEQLHAGDG
ncbi:hypothetical protein JCM14469_43180 [Desulfatiferula olefinivorans]